MELIHWLYSFTGIVMLLFYFPQMLAVTRAQDSLESISLLSWLVWSICMIVTTIYAYWALNDIKFTLFSALGALCCFYVASMTFGKRRRYRLAPPPDEDPSSPSDPERPKPLKKAS